MKIALLFDHFGPYHLARLRSIDAVAFGVEFFGKSGDYEWDRMDLSAVKVTTILDDGEQILGKKLLCKKIKATLSDCSPDVVAIPGWSSAGALAALEWCLQNHKPSILMTESNAHDEVRKLGKELLKRRLVQLFPAALAGGSFHVRYLQQLGMSREKIFLGYDVVDNSHFCNSASASRLIVSQTPFFLASARFIEKKNLHRLLKAYAAYRERVSCHPTLVSAWNLILLGDGELRPELEQLILELKIHDCVHMPGFKQYQELPNYYASASVFIHASTSEQWGLVVNEAMASGLPVLISNRCGCAPDLVQEGVNGFSFDPYDTQALSDRMFQLSLLAPEDLKSLGRASEAIINDWGPQRFGDGLLAAAKLALENELPWFSWIDRLLLKLLCLR